MDDLTRILDAIENLGSRRAVLATIVHGRDFSHCRPGTRYLVREDGSAAGSLGVVSLQREITERSLMVMGGQKAVLAVFDTAETPDEFREHNQKDRKIFSVLLEPLTSTSLLQFDLIRIVDEQKTQGVIATITRVQGELKVDVGSRIFLSPMGTIRETVKNPFVAAAMITEAERSLHNNSHSTTIRFTEGSVDVFLEVVQPQAPDGKLS